jgi:hypothetical protein
MEDSLSLCLFFPTLVLPFLYRWPLSILWLTMFCPEDGSILLYSIARNHHYTSRRYSQEHTIFCTTEEAMGPT